MNTCCKVKSYCIKVLCTQMDNLFKTFSCFTYILCRFSKLYNFESYIFLLGLGLDLPLLEWLEKYTFPTEAKFSQPRFASQVKEYCHNYYFIKPKCILIICKCSVYGIIWYNKRHLFQDPFHLMYIIHILKNRMQKNV